MKKVVSFDVWGTLIKANPLYRPARNKLIAEILFPEISSVLLPSEWEVLIKRTKDFCDFSNEVLGKQMSWEQSILVVARDSFHLLPKIDFTSRFERYKNTNRRLIKQYPPEVYSKETSLTLELLKDQNIHMVAVCNTGFINHTDMELIMQILQFRKYLKSIVYSDMIGFSKPNEVIFNSIYGTFHNKSIIHVGDNPFSDGGCTKVGVDFLHINGDSGKTISEILKYV